MDEENRPIRAVDVLNADVGRLGLGVNDQDGQALAVGGQDRIFDQAQDAWLPPGTGTPPAGTTNARMSAALDSGSWSTA